MYQELSMLLPRDWSGGWGAGGGGNSCGLLAQPPQSFSACYGPDVDAKIMSKVIAARIKNVLPNIIHHNQTGFIKDRYIGETVRSIFDIMELTVEENIPGLMIFIDVQKAFDS